ncbi:MAG: S8 family serine peptidase [Rhodothermales bacterium]
MDFITLLTVIAFLLIALNITSTDKNPMVMLVGLGLLGVTVVTRLLSGGGFFETFTPLFTDVGLSLLIAAGWLALRKANANPQPFFVLGLLSLGIAGACYVGAQFFGRADTRTPAEQGTFLLELGPDDRIDEVASVLEHYRASYERAFPTITLDTDEDLAQIYLVYGDPASFDALMAALREDAENVDFVELNRTVSLTPPVESETPVEITRRYLENDPLVSNQWGLEGIQGHEAHAILRELTPVRKARVAIVDTGVDGKHEDLQSVFLKSPGATDPHGHGTHCAGIAGGATNNNLGIASLNWNDAFVEVTGYRALGATGSGSLESIAQAVIDAAKGDADVISMSLGDTAPRPPKVLVDAIEFAQRRGAIVLASAGNSNRDAYNHFPSNIKGVMAISAVDQNLNKAGFSNTNTSLTRPLAAPGVDILSLVPGNEYRTMSGTSMATPVVAGLLGVMRALNPDLTAEQAYSILHETGTVVRDSDRVGRVVNAEAAILAVRVAL